MELEYTKRNFTLENRVCVGCWQNKKHGLQANKTQAGQIRDEPKIGLETNTTR